MKAGRAQEQFVVLRIRGGQHVSDAELKRAVDGGYVVIHSGGKTTITEKGQVFLGHA